MIINGTVVSTQVCIIGSGPAGITAAWHLQKAGIKVTLIEGSRDFDNNLEASWPDKVLLYDGVADGLFASNEREFLVLPYDGHKRPAWERERIYGGTSAHWGGQCRPLDPITFEKREGFPGWPIDRRDLDPYYKQAVKFCKLHADDLYPDDFSAAYWAKILPAQDPNLARIDAEMYQFVDKKYRNFATRTFDGKTIGDSVDVILNASLLDIDHTHGAVSGLRVASMDDSSPPQKATEFTVRADAYVLACGAVANARQLLLSNVGNEHGLVGRYFMCHPIPTVQVVTIEKPYLTDAEERLMNGETPNGSKWKDLNGVNAGGRFSPNAQAQRDLKIGGCWFQAGGRYYFEMAPNPDSRVTLADTRDSVFCQQQTRITWGLTDRDETTYNRSTELFKAAVKERKGDVSFASWETVKSHLVVNGHHIGTTRMSNEPTHGVVDANLKVHSLDNLYVAGASVYPSAGISNPTFTIVTLSIRLAEHLSKRLSSSTPR
jgi:choline dehydrogenase-like flavoprotein